MREAGLNEMGMKGKLKDSLSVTSKLPYNPHTLELQ